MAKSATISSESKQSLIKTHFDAEQRAEGGNAVIEIPMDDAKHVIWDKEGSKKLHLLKFNISKHYPLRFISLDLNPRQFQRRSVITSDIMNTLSSDKLDFSDVSHPVHWVGSVVVKDGKLLLKVDSIMDGGHRHLSILDASANNVLRPHHTINVFLYEGFDADVLKEISKGLNSNRSPKPKTIMNFENCFEMFKRALPEQFNKGLIEVMENQPDTKIKIEDMARLVTIGDPAWKDSLTAIYQGRQDALNKFAVYYKEYAKKFPKETLQIIFQIHDFVHLYLADVFSDSHPDLMKRVPFVKKGSESNAKKREMAPRKKSLIFIDKTIQGISEKNYYYAIVLGIMQKHLSEKNGKMEWPQFIKESPEKFCRKLVYNIGKKVGVIIKSSKRFGSDSLSWKKISSLV